MISIASFTAICLAALRLLAVSAVPNVSVVPSYRTDCSIWPNWYNETDGDISGSFEFVVDQADDPTVDGLLTTFGPNNSSGTSIQTVSISLLKSRRVEQQIYRCFNGMPYIKIRNFEDATLNGPMRLAENAHNARIVFGAGIKLGAFEHEIAGIRQPGKFLGANNQTTWSFRYREPRACGEREVYEIRLLGLSQNTNATAVFSNGDTTEENQEFTGFIKVVPL